MAVERRKTRRASIPGMRVAFEAAAGELVEADVLDVGTGGLFIRTAKPVAVGKRLSLEVAAVPGIAAWTALGRVVWTRDTGTRDAPPGMGVKLIDVDDVAIATIDRAVEAREKARTGAAADGELPDVHGMTTRVVEVPRMVEPETPPREEEPPPPAPGTWGEHPPLPSQIEQADIERREGGGMRTMIQILDSDPGDLLAAALAGLGRAIQSGNPQ